MHRNVRWFKIANRMPLSFISSPVTTSSSPNHRYPVAEDQAIVNYFTLLENSLSIKNPGKLTKNWGFLDMASTSNQFNVLDQGIHQVFKGLDAYIGIPCLGTAIESFNECLMENNSPEERLDALRTDLDQSILI